MCGIVGALDLTGNRDFPAEWLRAMTMAIAHRGPDDEYFHREPGLALGTRWLAIVDLAGGRQPLANEDETVWVSFNRVIRPGHYVRVRDGRIDRAVSYSERDRWHNVGPFGLMRSASDRLCLAASSSIHPDASPRHCLGVAWTRVEDNSPESAGLGPVALAPRPGRLSSAGSGAVDALVDAAELVGTLRRQDPPPVGFGLVSNIRAQKGIAQFTQTLLRYS
ncbi:MAG: hypothetical protein JO114_23045 [Planctomycetaceae bacterium]|nr:hypothetical protein [Planctomycetaceae bacterium]MBV8312020.1 hypothetical protein [Planctomycetaceae bacterium]